MQWFYSLYNTVEKTFFYTLNRKIVGNLAFLFAIQLFSYFQLSNLISDGEKGSFYGVMLFSSLAFAFTLFYMRYLIVKPVKHMLRTLESINSKEGDLSQRLPRFSHDEFGELAKSYNQLASSLQTILQDTYTHALSASEVNQQVLASVEEGMTSTDKQFSYGQAIHDSCDQLKHNLHSISKNVNDISSTTKINVKTAHDSSLDLINMQGEINGINELLGNFAQTVVKLSESASNIRNILKLVEGFSEQTNLLALNAAIEAARAGESGRGFAVVADEVRTLAQKVNSATSEINEHITSMENLVHDTEQESSQLYEESDQLKEKMGENSDKFKLMVDELNKDLAALSELETAISIANSASEENDQLATSINQLGQKISDSILEVNQSTKTMMEETDITKEQLSRFV